MTQKESPSTITIALAQAYSPFTLAAALEQTAEWAERAANGGAHLVVFPEAWMPGYPVWLDVCRDVAIWDNAAIRELYAQSWANSLDLNSEHGQRLRAIARDFNIAIVMGAMEREGSGPAHGTIYNSLLTVGSDGRLLNSHRKLMPTHGERLLWGIGDSAGLRTSTIRGVRAGGLICWEHWMPLARQALHIEGEDLHIALWPTVSEMHLVASRHYAFEGRCHVLAVGSVMRARDLPRGLEPHPSKVTSPDQYLLRGGSCVIAPNGDILTEQIFDEERLVLAELNPGRNVGDRMTLDVAGHYSRSDTLELLVRPSTKRRVHD